ncbi:hypothetical protein B4110_3626 [Parageobacillus toebii]|uniref:Uncharacterized protein n=2 Tax=Parageobacillus toebii TaxID=153151 RepID=A0A150N788_9BACL|nr:hypothetical protein B4110_3626 [Parageobacillus toebii]
MRGHKHHHSSDNHTIKELQEQITKLRADNEQLKKQLESK